MNLWEIDQEISAYHSKMRLIELYIRLEFISLAKKVFHLIYVYKLKISNFTIQK